MKIISWNSNGKFREKYKEIIKYNADVYVIQECENPNECSDKEYKTFAQNSVWIGDKNNRGLGIFAKKDIEIKELNWNSYCLKYFFICAN